MASRPPDDRMRATPPTDRERGRFLVLNVVRLSGAALVLVALLVLNGAIGLPAVVGWVFLGVGLLDVFVVPQLLARKWRTPPE
ncbi:hypothetical protein N0B51_08450 [Tsuneonella sp. YG55]|uniref:Uncharacterized protein n=1 Tax=Tsuneonella litorea TaxID=2976475 RepID=A0A9X3AKZ6_9SPHN|nr:hypothetical protein [Tsuneonella litorea]MCT2559009.1 hypothetical protein [Tsuneonella litorea]